MIVIPKRRKKYYLIILLLALLFALMIPFAMEKLRSTEKPIYYYPHDTDRQNYLEKKSDVK